VSLHGKPGRVPIEDPDSGNGSSATYDPDANGGGFVGRRRRGYAELFATCVHHELAIVLYLWIEQRARFDSDLRGLVVYTIDQLTQQFERAESTIRKELKHLRDSGWIEVVKSGCRGAPTRARLPRYPPPVSKRRRNASPGQRNSTLAPSNAPSTPPSNATVQPPSCRRNELPNNNCYNDLEPPNQTTNKPGNHENHQTKSGLVKRSQQEEEQSESSEEMATLWTALASSCLDLDLKRGNLKDTAFIKRMIRYAEGIGSALEVAAELRFDPSEIITNPRGLLTNRMKAKGVQVRIACAQAELADVPPAGSELADVVTQIGAAKRFS
jgi:hypothetical protein